MKRLIVGAVAVCALLLTACSTESGDPSPDLDEAGTRGCNMFAKWQADGANPATRPEVARKIHAQASNSNSGEIDDKAEVLFRMSSTKRAETWTLVADSFAAECLRLGWTAADAG